MNFLGGEHIDLVGSDDETPSMSRQSSIQQIRRSSFSLTYFCNKGKTLKHLTISEDIFDEVDPGDMNTGELQHKLKLLQQDNDQLRTRLKQADKHSGQRLLNSMTPAKPSRPPQFDEHAASATDDDDEREPQESLPPTALLKEVETLKAGLEALESKNEEYRGKIHSLQEALRQRVPPLPCFPIFTPFPL